MNKWNVIIGVLMVVALTIVVVSIAVTSDRSDIRDLEFKISCVESGGSAIKTSGGWVCVR